MYTCMYKNAYLLHASAHPHSFMVKGELCVTAHHVIAWWIMYSAKFSYCGSDSQYCQWVTHIATNYSDVLEVPWHLAKNQTTTLKLIDQSFRIIHLSFSATNLALLPNLHPVHPDFTSQQINSGEVGGGGGEGCPQTKLHVVSIQHAEILECQITG